jgi:hypothetical protein
MAAALRPRTGTFKSCDADTPGGSESCAADKAYGSEPFPPGYAVWIFRAAWMALASCPAPRGSSGACEDPGRASRGCQAARPAAGSWGRPAIAGWPGSCAPAGTRRGQGRKPSRDKPAGASPGAGRRPHAAPGLAGRRCCPFYRKCFSVTAGQGPQPLRPGGRWPAAPRRPPSGRPGPRRWRAPGWRFPAAAGAPGSGSGCGGRLSA